MTQMEVSHSVVIANILICGPQRRRLEVARGLRSRSRREIVAILGQF